MLYAVMGSWSDTDVSFSYLPDGTSTEGHQSSLYAELDPVADTAIWQREFARALQTWSNSSNLNFHQVADDGSPTGTSGQGQGDSRFGDIRLGAHPLDSYVAYAYYPSSSTLGGDITLNPNYNYQIGAKIDLYTVLLHESGHSLGLGHSTSDTIMGPNVGGVDTGLTADDIAGIQAIYGARQDDQFDLGGPNDSLAAASSLNIDSAGNGIFAADLTTMDDLDYYRLVAPADADGSLTVSVDVDGLSLLAPQVSLYDSAGTLVGAANVGDVYGTTATVQLSGVVAGETYYVMADGATTDAFGMGAYRLDVDFGVPDGGGDPEPPAEPPAIAADRFESNDTLLTATELGQLNNRTETGLTLHTATDVDTFHFSARKAGDFNITTSFAAAADYEITIYDASMNLLSQTSGSSAQVTLSRGEDALVQVRSLAAETDVYDLLIERVGGTGKGGTKGGKGNGKGGLIAQHDAGQETCGQTTASTDRVGLLASSQFTSNHRQPVDFNRPADTVGHRWHSTYATGSRQVDGLRPADAGYTETGDAHRPGTTRRADSQMAPLADVAPSFDRFDMEATLEDLAGEWVRVFAEV
jgi:hypothetical protein